MKFNWWAYMNEVDTGHFARPSVVDLSIVKKMNRNEMVMAWKPANTRSISNHPWVANGNVPWPGRPSAG